MIKSIKISNFCSIGAEQRIEFNILKKDVLDESAANINGYNINLINCIIGHNASGKTTILKAITFLFWLVRQSYTSMKMEEFIPIDCHKFFKAELTQISLEFFNQEHLYQYKVQLNENGIHSEFLGEHVKKGYSRIFQYERSNDSWEFKSKLEINNNDLLRFEKRKNVSVLSSLIETGYLPELTYFKKIYSNVTKMGNIGTHSWLAFMDVSNFLHKDIDLQKDALSFIEDVDLGISGFDFSEVVRMKNNIKVEDSEKQPILECIHKSKLGEFKLPLIDESNGTIRGLEILAELIPILKTGGVAILDELESGLHPYVIKKIISLFENTQTNPNHAQLIFSTHQHLLLNDRTKTQIFIAEKDNENFATEVFCLNHVEGIRNDENYYNKYLTGTYGGIGNVKWVKA